MQARPRGNAAAASDTLRRGQRSRGTDLTNRVAAGLNTRRALRRLRPPEGVPILPLPSQIEHLAVDMEARYKATSHACTESTPSYTPDMVTITEVEKLAFDLPDSQRAVLAAHLLRSLPSVLHDEDEGVAEALRRDAEFDANPEIGITLEQLDQQISARRR